jgi:arabinan endo-1,5-alpha-L-arabinosidase
MTDLEAPPASIGTKVLGSHRFDGATGWLAPGHNSVLTQDGPDGGEEHFLVHHVRFADDPSQHIVQLRRLFFNAAGWPVVSPQPYAGREREVLGSAQQLSGRWRVVRFDPDSTDLVDAVPLELESDSHEPFDGGPAAVRLRADGLDLDAVVFGSWDWSRGEAALSFSGIDRHGVAWCGTKGA